MPRKPDIIDESGRPLDGEEKPVWSQNLANSAVGIVVLLTVGLFVAAFWLIFQTIKATIRRPKIMIPILLGIIALVVLGIVCSPTNQSAPKPATGPTPPATARPVIGSPTTAVSPAPSPRPSPSVVAIQWIKVANTGGEGVFLRKSPRMDDKSTAWTEGTRMRVIGPDVDSEGRRWKHVADPDGRTGFVPAEYTEPASGP
jgi:hypothetical protein